MSYRYYKIFRGEYHSRVGASDVRIQHRFRMAGPKEANFRSPLPGGARSLSMTWSPPAGQPIFLGPPPSITYSPLTVIPKPLPYAGVRKTVSTLLRLGRIGELECQQWEDYLTPFQEEDGRVCATCADLRQIQQANVDSRHLPVDERRERRRRRDHATKALNEHLQTLALPDRNHQRRRIDFPLPRPEHGVLHRRGGVDPGAGEFKCADGIAESKVEGAHPPFMIGNQSIRRRRAPAVGEGRAWVNSFVAVVHDLAETKWSLMKIKKIEANGLVKGRWYGNIAANPYVKVVPGWGGDQHHLWQKHCRRRGFGHYEATVHRDTIITWGLKMVDGVLSTRDGLLVDRYLVWGSGVRAKQELDDNTPLNRVRRVVDTARKSTIAQLREHYNRGYDENALGTSAEEVSGDDE